MTTYLVTGASGEVGSSLVKFLSAGSSAKIIALDLKELPPELQGCCAATYKGDVSDERFISEVGQRHNVDTVFHLAGILSSGGERNPTLAHRVNVAGTMNLLELARVQSELRDESVKFIFTSTIAVYGIESLAKKRLAGTVSEQQYLQPVTMYGANKLYCERLGCYYSNHFGLLDKVTRARLDFRCVRYPGLLNAHTLPTGGTSDYAPEMVHAFAQGQNYECFVRADSKLPFMMMPDALRALVQLADAPKEKLSQGVYNVGSFAASAEEFASALEKYFPGQTVSYKSHPQRQQIVDSWPDDVSDASARKDWGWKPDYSFDSGLLEYLVPEVTRQYKIAKAANS